MVNDDAKKDSEILIEQLFDLIVRKEVEGMVKGSHERECILSENTLLWVVIKREILAMLENNCFYLGLDNELLPSGVDSVYDLIKNIKTLKLKKGLKDDIVNTLMTSNCFKLNKENNNDK